jgi:hypothetical protein
VDGRGGQAVGSLPRRARSADQHLRWSSTSSIASSASLHRGREGSSVREMAVAAGSDFASGVPTANIWAVLRSPVDARASLHAAGSYVDASRLGIFRLGGPTLLYTDDADSVSAMSWPSARVGYALLLHRGLIRTVDGGRHWRRP